MLQDDCRILEMFRNYMHWEQPGLATLARLGGTNHTRDRPTVLERLHAWTCRAQHIQHVRLGDAALHVAPHLRNEESALCREWSASCMPGVASQVYLRK
eukprot:scaffold1629_cov369-Prasinococcus_capsulatus_cf.AAC.31